MTTTALDLIKRAMSKLNVLQAGETPSADDVAIGLDALNTLMLSLENEGIFNYTATRTTATLPASTSSRTIGPAMQIAMTRPVKLLRGSYSRVDGVDYPLDPISEAEYNEISLKTGVSSVVPSVCFYDGGSPTGVVYFWPVPTGSVELHLLSPAPGGVATSSVTEYTFPPGYKRMIENGLALELAPDFNVPPNPMVSAMYASEKRAIRRANRVIPQLDMCEMTSVASDFYAGQ
ncbi:MAG: hypothetical protein IPO08_21435 [Xanthomonadales bacterium]|nr:hypothetical protein [Xanthomonadales bacterium]